MNNNSLILDRIKEELVMLKSVFSEYENFQAGIKKQPCHVFKDKWLDNTQQDLYRFVQKMQQMELSPANGPQFIFSFEELTNEIRDYMLKMWNKAENLKLVDRYGKDKKLKHNIDNLLNYIDFQLQPIFEEFHRHN